jgi:Glycosyltransferase like family 2
MTSDLFSGDAGDVTHPWRRAKRAVGGVAFSAIDLALLTRPRVNRMAGRQPARRVLVASVYRPGSLLAGALPRLASDHHDVTFALGAVESVEATLAEHTVVEGLGGGKFGNLNRVLGTVSAEAPASRSGGGAQASAVLDFDWILVVDDDLVLPPHFLDRFVALCERFSLDLAQPAQTLRSHSAWRVTRRRPASLARETRFVEIGPLTAFGRRAAAELLPFPELRFGWGLDLHWAAIAEERGWRLGVVDATPVRHESATVGSAYPSAEAEAEAADFLATREHLPASRAGDVVAVHRRTGR